MTVWIFNGVVFRWRWMARFECETNHCADFFVGKLSRVFLKIIGRDVIVWLGVRGWEGVTLSYRRLVCLRVSVIRFGGSYHSSVTYATLPSHQYWRHSPSPYRTQSPSLQTTSQPQHQTGVIVITNRKIFIFLIRFFSFSSLILGISSIGRNRKTSSPWHSKDKYQTNVANYLLSLFDSLDSPEIMTVMCCMP